MVSEPKYRSKRGAHGRQRLNARDSQPSTRRRGRLISSEASSTPMATAVSPTISPSSGAASSEGFSARNRDYGLSTCGSSIIGPRAVVLETRRTHRSFTAKTAKNIAMGIAFLTHHSISSTVNRKGQMQASPATFGRDGLWTHRPIH